MRRWFQVGALAVLGGWLCAPAVADIIDRIVVLVNGNPVLLSEWQEALRYEAMLEGRTLESVTPEQEQAALDRLIDQELIRQQIQGRNLPASGKEAASRRVEEIRRQLPGAAENEAWQGMLLRYGLTEEQVRERVEAQLDMLRFVDSQIRPGVRVGNTRVLNYYREKFVPEVQRAGAPVPPFEEVSDKIREILVQQRVDERLQQWLADLRRQSDIRVQLERPTGTAKAEPQ